MQLYTTLADLPDGFSAGALTIGNFDGVHRGHAQLIERLTQRAREFAGPAVVFTFEPHPVRLLRPEAAPAPLTWVSRKAELLSYLSVDVVVAYPTTREFLSLSAHEYFQQIIRDQLCAKAIVEGPNFFFGKDRQGDVALLRDLCDQNSISLDVVEPVTAGDAFVSSSRVRSAIAAGDVDTANAMLTQPYRIRGMVTHGAGRGATIGFPTANISAVDTLLPGVGVYAGIAYVNASPFRAAINIGPNPTFNEDQLKVEAHLLDYEGSLYGTPLEVDFTHRLRDIRKFTNQDELVVQLDQDIADVRRLVVELPPQPPQSSPPFSEG